jgi:hypothetical protein
MADLTFYPTPGVLRTLGWIDRSPGAEPRESLDVMVSFTGGKLYRAIVCSCYAGRRCAVTTRKTERDAGADDFPEIDWPRDVRQHRRSLRRWPGDSARATERKHGDQNREFVETTWGFRDAQRLRSEHGLVVVAGETGARKTTYAREIARRHILTLLKKKDFERPHIVTFEDPIESWFASSPGQARSCGFDYTPRQKGIDADDLEHAVTDALRQKPALLYVSEVRHEPEWTWLLDFASTGHLAITTTHAGSLVETFERILAAAKANTPAKRSEVAGRIIAIVHLKWIESALVPALWVQTPRGRMDLTREGLGALLATGAECHELRMRHDNGHEIPAAGCYGRAFFAKMLRLPRPVIRAALEADLNGE